VQGEETLETNDKTLTALDEACYANEEAENELAALRVDARRFRELRRRFDDTKTSQALRVLEALGLPENASAPFEQIIDEAMEMPVTTDGRG